MTVADHHRALITIAAKWACNMVSDSDVVDTAVDALVAGVDSTSLVLLAGTTRAEAADEVRELLPAAMEELGLPYFGREHPQTGLIAAASIAREHLAGNLAAERLCGIVHQRIGHDSHELVEVLACLDDEYDVASPSGGSPAEFQVRVRAAAVALDEELRMVEVAAGRQS